MPIFEFRTPEGVTLRLPLAGAGSRFGAALVDVLIFGTGWLSLLLVLVVLSSRDTSGFSDFVTYTWIASSVLVFLAALVVVHVALQGRTPGKALFDLRVVSQDGQPASLVQYMLRSVLWLLDGLPAPVPIGILASLAGGSYQRFGDRVAGTLVVHEPKLVSSGEPFPSETFEGLQLSELGLTPAVAARFDAEDLDFLREVITRRGLDRDGKQRLYEEVTRHYLKRLGHPDPVSPRIALKELYLFLRGQRQRGA